MSESTFSLKNTNFWDNARQFWSHCDAARSLLVSFSVVSLKADARIWITFSLWYCWQLTTHPETKHHILQLHVNCCCYLCPRNTKTYSIRFHAHTLWRAVSVCVLSHFFFFFCLCEKHFNFKSVPWLQVLFTLWFIYGVHINMAFHRGRTFNGKCMTNEQLKQGDLPF